MNTPQTEEVITRDVIINGERFPAVFGERRKRGGDEGDKLPVATIRVSLPDNVDTHTPLNSFGDFLRFVKAIGPLTFVNAVIRDLVKPSCNEASSEARNEETGDFDLVKYVKALTDWYQAPDRRIGGPKLAEITKTMADLSMELNKILSEWMVKPFGEWPESVQNRAVVIRTEISKFGALMDKKSNLGRKKKVAPAPVPVAA